MHELRRKQIKKNLLAIFLVVLLDQLVKLCISKSLFIPMGGFFNLTCNQNISWGIPISSSLFIFLWIAAFIFLIYLANYFNWSMPLSLVIGGSLGNIIDRIYLGCVIDYISIGNFPIFNIADIFITTGLVLFVIETFFKKENKN